MPRHHERRVLPYSPEQMFAMVADVRRYAEFLPWVSAVRVREETPTLAVADLIVGFSGLRETFTSRVHKVRPRSIDVDYVDGPLSRLTNCWRFLPHADGCEVDFTVDFAFKNRVFEMIAGQMFDLALRQMIAAFETRAARLYGHPQAGTLSPA
jgi:coenzyme Q-binding protein COQ10